LTAGHSDQTIQTPTRRRGRGRCTIAGTPEADVLKGTRRRDVICGGGGDDTLLGRRGDDVLLGGAGRDVLRGAAGDDRTAGAGGADLLDAGGGKDVVSGGTGDDDIDGGPRADEIDGGGGVNVCSLDAADDAVRCRYDHQAPVAMTPVFSASSLDVTATGGTVTVSVRVIDDTGVESVTFRPGAGLLWYPVGDAELSSGTRRNGVWTATLAFSRWARPGTYQPRVQMFDRGGRRQVTLFDDVGVVVANTNPDLVTGATGRVGTGLTFGALGPVEAPVSAPVRGTVTTAVANLPDRTSDSGFASSMRTLTADKPDFVMLNEVGRRSVEVLRSTAPGYGAYRDPQVDRTLGGVQSMKNVVMWHTGRWVLVDAGRVKLVDDDTGYHSDRPFTWDRYATWAILQRYDGAIVSVVSTHMMTNPARFPRQHGTPTETRVQRFSRGMDVLVDTVASLAAHGPVLVGGDMNSHPNEGSWTSAAKMSAAGFQYAKDRGVMYLFLQRGVRVVTHRQVTVASDHPAIVTALDMNGQGPS
jgi:endonuclease/exonuclease/phosphatase family metal-dependent hydrolase